MVDALFHSTPGGVHGCVGAIILSPEGKDERKVKEWEGRDSVQGKRKIYTSTAPKGGFGYPLSCRTLGDTLQYMPDEFQPGRAIEKVTYCKS